MVDLVRKWWWVVALTGMVAFSVGFSSVTELVGTAPPGDVRLGHGSSHDSGSLAGRPLHQAGPLLSGRGRRLPLTSAVASTATCSTTPGAERGGTVSRRLICTIEPEERAAQRLERAFACGPSCHCLRCKIC